MLKLVGALVLVGVSAWAGLDRSAQLRRQAACLAGLITALEIMKSEICTRLTPMPELVGRLGETGPEPARLFFKRVEGGLGFLGDTDFPRLWSRAVAASSELQLGAEERVALTNLGLMLGRYTAAEQESAIDRCLDRLERAHGLAEARFRTEGRLYAGLGLAFGITLVLVLL